jgi:HK97 family phage major capsid protein
MSDLGLSKAETQRFSLFKAIRAMRTPTAANVQAAGYEIECSNALAKRLDRADSGSIFVPGEVLQRPLGAEAATRAMATTPGAAGGYLVNVENMGFLDILRNRSVLMSMGARRLPGLVGNVVLARQTGKATVTWQGGEGVSVTASDQTLGQLSMTPKTAIVITDVSEQLLRQSTPSAEAFVMADLAADIAIDGVDKKGISGAGGAEPLGIKNTTGVTNNQSASTFSYTKALAFPVAAGGSNAIRGNPGWVTNIAGAAICMQRARFSNTDTPIWVGNLLDGQLVGFRAMSSEQMASGEILFGSFDEVVIGEWGVLELAMDNGGTRFNQAQVGIRAMWMVDVLVRYPAAFVMGTDLS